MGFIIFVFLCLSNKVVKLTCPAIFNSIINHKTKLSESNIHLKGNQYMITSWDCQLLYCQKHILQTIYISIQINNTQLKDLTKHPGPTP